MRKLGVSVYPGHSEIKDILAYLELAAGYGFSRVFTCLLSVGNQEETIEDFKKTVSLATSLGMEVIADVDLSVFEKLGLKYDNLEFFKNMGLTGIRLDGGFSGQEEASMTFNSQNLLIELNMSVENRYLENIAAFQPKFENLIGCHNFYPHRYTGISVEHFLNTSKRYKDIGVRTAAFVNSKVAKIGPWPVEEGLCTLEMHRDWEITSATKWLWATELIDDVIIANSFASEEELQTLSEIDPYLLTLDCELTSGNTEIENHIILEEPHMVRGDTTDYMFRSSLSRITHKKDHFEPHDTNPIERGDILIDNSLYTKYAGELQIARLPMDNSGKTNVVGHILKQDHALLDLLKPWQKFQFRHTKN
ncbi:MAG: MupG family TIM beta-alpha barrel fold protein [Streptococcus sp.]|nr:MupG family TIM beta-alpha barrel fold protein [Streptococcus sp.]